MASGDKAIKHHSRVNLGGESFEGDTRRHCKETRGRREAYTSEGDMGRHWKSLKRDTWRHWKETRRDVEKNETRGNIKRRHMETLEGEMQRRWKKTRGDIGKRHWKETREEIGRKHEETLEGYTWRHYMDTRGDMSRRHEDTWKHVSETDWRTHGLEDTWIGGDIDLQWIGDRLEDTDWRTHGL